MRRMDDPLAGKKPDISYPTEWGYRIVCSDGDAVRAHVAVCLEGRAYTLEHSHDSKRGAYTSLRLTVTVVDEADRFEIFGRIAEHDDVKMVI